MPIINNGYSIYRDQTDSLQYLATPQNKKLLYYATSAGHETLRSDYTMDREDINIYMINYIVKGSVRLTVEGVETELKQGDLTFLHLIKHSVLSAVDDGTEIVYFHVLGAQTEDIYNAYLEKGGYVLHDVPNEILSESFIRFKQAVESEKGFYDQSRIIYYLLTEILRMRENEAQTKYPKFIDKIMCYILYTCPVPSPTEVARQFGFNQIYLERLFKRYVGESLRNYILKQKYGFACRFLTDTDMSVSEIAQKVGYSDSKGLISLFSKFGDLTPLAYRKKKRDRLSVRRTFDIPENQ